MLEKLPSFLKFEEYIFDLRQSKMYYQLKDDYGIWGKPRDCSYGGCPAVVPLIPDDQPDVWFNKDWQFYLVAINYGMPLNSIVHLMGDTKFAMNGTGIGGEKPRNNYITGDIGYEKDPATDKFRDMCLNARVGYNDGTYFYPLALDGSQPPPMKQGKPRPSQLSEIIPDDYLIMPRTHPEFFIDCNNVKWKPDTKTLDYGPFANGIQREWIQDGNIHTFFPFVTNYKNVRTPLNWWIPVGSTYPSPFRH